MTKSFRYHTCCVNSTAELICPMVDRMREITWRTFLKYVKVEHLREFSPSSIYSYQGELYNPVTGEMTIGFHIKDDFAVTFFKSVYDGLPCYGFVHSGIEYVFLEDCWQD